jgi:hypothetical protein
MVNHGSTHPTPEHNSSRGMHGPDTGSPTCGTTVAIGQTCNISNASSSWHSPEESFKMNYPRA